MDCTCLSSPHPPPSPPVRRWPSKFWALATPKSQPAAATAYHAMLASCRIRGIMSQIPPKVMRRWQLWAPEYSVAVVSNAPKGTSGLLSRKMETTGSSHGQTNQLADDRSKATKGQALLDRGQNILVLVAFAIDNAIRMQSGLRHGRREQVGPGQTPEDLSLGALYAPMDSVRCKQFRKETAGMVISSAK